MGTTMRDLHSRRSRGLLTLGAVGLTMAATAVMQTDTRLLRRWVGIHEGRPLTLDFYGDTMLVVNDDYAVDYRARGGLLEVTGDTSFTASYWFAMERLLLRTEAGNVVTMTSQSPLARPLDGRWRGGALGAGLRVELDLRRGGVAQWRRLPGGGWVPGEWDRASRVITFTWLPDSVTWIARYDPGGNALLFEDLDVEGGTLILHRAFRW